MQKLRLAAVSRNYFNLPIWIGLHEGLFAAEGLAVALELHEPIDAVLYRPALSRGRRRRVGRSMSLGDQ